MADTSSSTFKQTRKGPKRTAMRTDMFGTAHKCSRCNKWLAPEMFYKASRHVSNNGLSYICKPCDRKYQLQRYAESDDQDRAKRYVANRKYMTDNVRGRTLAMVNSARQRSRKQGWQFDISTDDFVGILKAGRCEATGIRFKFETSDKGITPFSPSLDRIDSNTGYTQKNVQMVCSVYNIGKGAHEETDFIAMCLIVAERNKHNAIALQRAKELLE